VSYLSISKCVEDHDFVSRTRACAVQEGADPNTIQSELYWWVSTRADIEAAYASALAAGSPNPGGDEAVITDGMILSAVQAAPASGETKPAPAKTSTRR